jgi:hypothetical protein
MRVILMALAAVTALAAVGIQSAQAQFNRPVCSRGGGPDSSGLDDCSFNTYAQCEATVKGLGRYCIDNPEIAWRARGWKDPNDPPAKTERHRK